jgi:hypothetical protein
MLGLHPLSSASDPFGRWPLPCPSRTVLLVLPSPIALLTSGDRQPEFVPDAERRCPSVPLAGYHLNTLSETHPRYALKRPWGPCLNLTIPFREELYHAAAIPSLVSCSAGNSITFRSFGHYESRSFGLPCVII